MNVLPITQERELVDFYSDESEITLNYKVQLSPEHAKKYSSKLKWPKSDFDNYYVFTILAYYLNQTSEEKNSALYQKIKSFQDIFPISENSPHMREGEYWDPDKQKYINVNSMSVRLPQVVDDVVGLNLSKKEYDEYSSYFIDVDSMAQRIDLVHELYSQYEKINTSLEEIIAGINSLHPSFNFIFLESSDNYVIDFNYLLSHFRLPPEEEELLYYWDSTLGDSFQSNAISMGSIEQAIEGIYSAAHISSLASVYILCETDGENIDFLNMSDTAKGNNKFFLSPDPQEAFALFSNVPSALAGAPDFYKDSPNTLYAAHYKLGVLSDLVSLGKQKKQRWINLDPAGHDRIKSLIQAALDKVLLGKAVPIKTAALSFSSEPSSKNKKFKV